MKNLKPATYGYLFATILLVVLVGWVGGYTWHELQQLHRTFVSLQADDLYASEHIEASVRDLNETVQRFDLHRNPADRVAFEQASGGLLQWIHAHQNALTTPLQCRLMDQIEAAFQVYLAQINQLLDERVKTGIAPPEPPVFEQVTRVASPVVALCRALKMSERTEQTDFMKDSRGALGWVQQLLVALMVVLIVLAGTGIVALNRGVIGPLRVKLLETRALAARHEKLASLGTLAAGVAHEIRNPLTAINVRLHSLQKNLAPNSSEQEDALVIGHETLRLERLVRDFLQFARPAEPKFVTVSADSLLAKVESLLSVQLERVAIRLILDSVPDIWVRVDPNQIEQVLINLAQNAADSIERGGTITLRVRTAKARLGGVNAPVVVIEVSDTGKGIPPEVQKRMFDPFFTTKEEGTGLGLVIALRIVEKHHGTLECRSEPNRGTTFTLRLPRANPEENHEFAA